MHSTRVAGILAVLTIIMFSSTPVRGVVPMPSIGVKAGLNSSKLEVQGGGTSSRTGFVGGGYAKLPLESLTIQFEALYSQKGFRKGTFEGITDWEVKYDFLDFPVMLNLDIPMEGSVHPFFFAGFAFGIRLNATEKHSDTHGEWVDIDDKMKGSNWGIVFGGGVQFHNFNLDVRYNHGLTNLNKEEFRADVKDRTFSFMVGYAIWH